MPIKKLLNIVIFLFLCACAHPKDAAWQKVSVDFKKRGFAQKTYYQKTFNIFTLEKISDAAKPLHIYIEGDGFAYVNKFRPSIDPTPRSTFLLDLIAKDNAANIVYIARPCQYVDSAICEEKYWTQDRFSTIAIKAISSVVDRYKNYEINLIGYSGGAMIALHLPQKNIKTIRTIAGNLDAEEFVKLHKISPLKTPKIDYERLSKIPQIHFIGSRDEIIPLQIFAAYHKKLPSKNCVKIKVTPNATHNENWQQMWQYNLRSEPKCL